MTLSHQLYEIFQNELKFWKRMKVIQVCIIQVCIIQITCQKCFFVRKPRLINLPHERINKVKKCLIKNINSHVARISKIDEKAMYEFQFACYFHFKWISWFFRIHMKFSNFFYFYENTLIEKKIAAITAQLLIQSAGKFLGVTWNLVTKTYPKFVTLRSFFKIYKTIFLMKKNRDFEKAINSFETKWIGHLIIYGAIFFW